MLQITNIIHTKLIIKQTVLSPNICICVYEYVCIYVKKYLNTYNSWPNNTNPKNMSFLRFITRTAPDILKAEILLLTIKKE